MGSVGASAAPGEPCSALRSRAETAVMNPGDSGSGATTALVIRGADVTLLARLLQQQRRDGQATVDLIESADVAPPKGAPEPGKGRLVDVVG